jgi:hypothetical protein
MKKFPTLAALTSAVLAVSACADTGVSGTMPEGTQTIKILVYAYEANPEHDEGNLIPRESEALLIVHGYDDELKPAGARATPEDPNSPLLPLFTGSIYISASVGHTVEIDLGPGVARARVQVSYLGKMDESIRCTVYGPGGVQGEDKVSYVLRVQPQSRLGAALAECWYP